MMNRRRDERGAVAVLTAALLTALVVMAAFVVDIGMQRVARRDMQALADVVALDLSRELDGRSVGVLNPLMPGLAAQSRARNGGTIGSTPVLSVDLGQLSSTGAFSTMSSGVPSAVRVNAATTVAFAFGVSPSGSASRSAVGVSEKTACFKLGSYAAAVKTGNGSLLGPLNSLLGLNLSLLSYQGIAGAGITLDELVATGQVGTPDQLLTGATTYGTLANATLTALQNQSPQNSAAITALGLLINGSGNLGQTVRVGDTLNVAAGDGAALASTFNVLDLLVGAVLATNGTNALAVNGLSAGTATTGAVTGSLSVIERARTACGNLTNVPSMATCQSASPIPRGCARNSQLTGAVTIPLSIPTLNGFAITTTGSALSLNLGNATGRLVAPEPTCAAGTPASPDTQSVEVATSLATSTLSTALHFKQVLTVPLVLSTVKVVVEFDITIGASIPQSAGTTIAPLKIPPNDVTAVGGGSKAALGAPVTGTQSNLSVKIDNDGDGIGDVAVSTLGPVVQATINAVVDPLLSTTLSQVVTVLVPNVFTPLTDSINSLVIGPLANLLGLDVAGADVFAVDRPRCMAPLLVG